MELFDLSGKIAVITVQVQVLVKMQLLRMQKLAQMSHCLREEKKN